MTAAHRTLPFGTMVRVHDLENEKIGGRADQRPRSFRGWPDHRPVARGGAGHRDDRSRNGARAAGDSERARGERKRISACRWARSGTADNAERLRRAMEAKYGRARLVAARGYAGLVARGGGDGIHQDGALALANRIRGEDSSVTSAFVVRLDSV